MMGASIRSIVEGIGKKWLAPLGEQVFLLVFLLLVYAPVGCWVFIPVLWLLAYAPFSPVQLYAQSLLNPLISFSRIVIPYWTVVFVASIFYIFAMVIVALLLVRFRLHIPHQVDSLFHVIHRVAMVLGVLSIYAGAVLLPIDPLTTGFAALLYWMILRGPHGPAGFILLMND